MSRPRVRASLRHQIRVLWPLLLALYVPTGAILFFAQYLSIRDDHGMSRFTRDPLAHFDGASPFLGALSNLGVLLWAAAAAICAFTAVVLPPDRGSAEREGVPARTPRSFFIVFGLLTAWLCLDDLFLLHERLIPAWTSLPEVLFSGAYVVGFVVLLLVFRRWVVQSDFLPLVLACALFAYSILSDAVMDRSFRWHHLFEDGGKLLGIVAWLAYLSRVSLVAIRQSGSEIGRAERRDS